MVKAKKGLIFSIFALLLALVVTTSSTYAWFAMNAVVSANNMQITARADSSYLVIESTPSGTDSFSGKIGNISAAALDLSPVSPATPARVLPVAYRDLDGDGPATTMGWQTAVGTGYSNGAALGGNYTTVQESSLVSNGFAAKFSFVIGLNPYVSIQDASNLKISSITVADSGNSSLFPALSVLVVSSVGGVEQARDPYIGSGSSLSSPIAGSNTILAANILADGTPISIDVYVFINGDNSVVTTEHTQSTDLTTFTVSINFTCTPPSQNAPLNP